MTSSPLAARTSRVPWTTSTTLAPSWPSSSRRRSPSSWARPSSHDGTLAAATTNGSTTTARIGSTIQRPISASTGITNATTSGGARCDVNSSSSSTSAIDARATSPERRDRKYAGDRSRNRSYSSARRSSINLNDITWTTTTSSQPNSAIGIAKMTITHTRGQSSDVGEPWSALPISTAPTTAAPNVHTCTIRFVATPPANRARYGRSSPATGRRLRTRRRTGPISGTGACVATALIQRAPAPRRAARTGRQPPAVPRACRPQRAAPGRARGSGPPPAPSRGGGR